MKESTRIVVDYDRMWNQEEALLDMKQELLGRKLMLDFNISSGVQVDRMRELGNALVSYSQELLRMVEKTYEAAKAVHEEYQNTERELLHGILSTSADVMKKLK